MCSVKGGYLIYTISGAFHNYLKNFAIQHLISSLNGRPETGGKGEVYRNGSHVLALTKSISYKVTANVFAPNPGVKFVSLLSLTTKQQ